MLSYKEHRQVNNTDKLPLADKPDTTGNQPIWQHSLMLLSLLLAFYKILCRYNKVTKVVITTSTHNNNDRDMGYVM